MHLFKGNVGSGVFAMGDAVRNAGLMVGPWLIILLAIICVHCQHVLVRNISVTLTAFTSIRQNQVGKKFREFNSGLKLNTLY